MMIPINVCHCLKISEFDVKTIIFTKYKILKYPLVFRELETSNDIFLWLHIAVQRLTYIHRPERKPNGYYMTAIRGYYYLVICRTILRIVSKPGLSSGTSFQHLCMSSDKGSGQSCPDISGRKYGSSRFPTRSKISRFKIY